MYYSYLETEYVATSFSPARTDLALKLLSHDVVPGQLRLQDYHDLVPGQLQEHIFLSCINS